MEISYLIILFMTNSIQRETIKLKIRKGERISIT